MKSLTDKYFDFIKKCLPEEIEGTAVGIDIGTSEAKFIQLEKINNVYTVVGFGSIPLEDGDISKALSTVIEKLTFPCQHLYTSVCGKGTLIRYINFPRMSLSDLKSSFALETDKYFPFSQDQVYTDCFILDPEKKSAKMSIVVTAVKREIVDERVQVLKDLNLNADFVGLNSIALANVFHVLGDCGDPEKSKFSCVAIFDMGEDISTLTIMLNRLPRFTRDVFIGGKDFSERIANGLGISLKDAELLKRKSEDNDQTVISACDSVIMNLVQELKLSFDYFSSEKRVDVTKILITGGSARLKGLPDAMAEYLDLKVENWDPTSLIDIGENIDKDIFEKQSLKFGVALGLALFHYDKH